MNWLLIGLGFFSLFIQGYTDNLRGPLFGIIKDDLGINHSEASMMFIASSITGFLAGIFVHRVIEKAGSRIAYLTGLFFMMLAGFSMLLVESFLQLLIASLVLGLGFGMSAVLQNLFVTRGSPAQLRKRFLSGLHASYGLASFVAPAMVSLLLSQGLNWRLIFASSGLLSGALLLMAFLRPKNWNCDEDLQTPLGVSARRGPFVFSLALSFYVMAEIIIATRLPVYLSEVEGLSTELASLYLTGFFFLLLIGRLLSSVFELKFKLYWQIIAALFFSALLFILSLVFSKWIFLATGLLMAPIYAFFITLASEHYGRKMHTLLSINQSVAAISIIVMNIFVGKISDQVGLLAALSLGPVFLIFSLLLFVYHEKALVRS